MTGKPRRCRGCDARPVALKQRRYCYDCQPGGPFTPPPCRRCGSTRDYFTAGLCDWCHRDTWRGVESCLDCFAWGVTRTHEWLCQACIGWREKHPNVGACAICRERRHLGRGPYCRLCWRHASLAHRDVARVGRDYIPIDLAALNQGGQQLWLANMGHGRRFQQRWHGAPPAPPRTRSPRRSQSRFGQLALFDNRPPGATARRGIPPPRDWRVATELDQLAREMAAERGWSLTNTKRVRVALEAVLGFTEPGAPVCASDLDRLPHFGLQGVALARDVLARAGLLVEDRTPAVDAWFERTIAELPEPMAGELRVWFTVRRHGSATPPRSRPRTESTIRVQIRAAKPVLIAWAGHGRVSLREISRDDVLAALPPGGSPRAVAGSALRSIFRVLKGRRVVFANPTARVKTGSTDKRDPLPADPDLLRRTLDLADPAGAALAALFVFHAVRPGDLRRLLLTHVDDGRLHISGRVIPLAGPARQRVAAWLDYRNARWPRTVNPHLFIHPKTATRTGPVGERWLALKMGVPAWVLRDDRILDEAHASRGDPRRLAELFGLSVQAAYRYTATVEHPDLARDFT